MADVIDYANGEVQDDATTAYVIGKNRYAYRRSNSSIKEYSGETVFEAKNIEVPINWSSTAVDILAQKYFRKSGVPLQSKQIDEKGIFAKYRRSEPIDDTEFAGEMSAHQVFHRLAGCWTYWGIKKKYFTTAGEADQFYADTYHALYHQIAAPNSPQWFNTGLNWAYGIWTDASKSPLYYYDEDEGGVVKSTKAYVRPQVHACYIQSIGDNLIAEGGIMDLFAREAAVFKYGSGSGTNYSNLRAAKEKLSGGGISSGLMSFLKVGDASAGAIKSGGTTRRSARMVVLDIDHPEVEDFIYWKMHEENKVAALVTGSQVNKKLVQAIVDATTNDALDLASAKALNAGVPSSLIGRAMNANKYGYELDLHEFDADWQSEAYATVSGQNANNTVSITDKFMKALKTDDAWHLTARTDGSIMKTVAAKKLWNDIALAAWASADPGIHYVDIMNDWNTVSNDERIHATNPCSEYVFLDDTACNLASLNMVALYSIDPAAFIDNTIKYSKLFTTVLDISIEMAQFPAKLVAEKTAKYRTLGLGYANIGSLLMRMGLPYGADLQSQAMVSYITAIITGSAYLQSAKIAAKLAPFPRFAANKEPFMKVMGKHSAALRMVEFDPEGQMGGLLDKLEQQAERTWYDVVAQPSFRNAQVTVIAPTGTIGLIMDCDTTGIEPDFSLVKMKKLAGGGMMKIVNQSVEPALGYLGYTLSDQKAIIQHISGYGTMLSVNQLDKMGIDPLSVITLEDLEGVELEQLRGIVRTSYNTREVLGKLGQLDGGDYNYLLKDADVVANTDKLLYGHGTVEGSSLRKEHHRVFATATAPKGSSLVITPTEHMNILAAAQPFISGASSKTINMPESATREEIADMYLMAYEKGVKAVSIYRDGSKLSQPLMGAVVEKIKAIVAEQEVKQEPTYAITKNIYHQTGRARLPGRRNGYTQKAGISGHKIYIHTGEYLDGKLGEIFLDMHKEGTAFRAMMNNFALAVSLGLQYGVPLEEFVEAFVHTKFEPAGMVQDHPYIKNCNSIIDFIFRDLAITYLGRDDLAHIKPSEAPPLKQPEVKSVLVSSQTDELTFAEARALLDKENAVSKIEVHTATNIMQVIDAAPAADVYKEIDAPNDSVDKTTQAIEKSQALGYTGDSCSECNNFTMVHSGTCLRCDTCGATTGCS